MSQGRVTIEREKIRHRRPADIAFDDAEPATYRNEPVAVDPEPPLDGDWSDDTEGWDERGDDEWVLDPPAADGGVIWEETPRGGGSRRRADPADVDYGPEVELAGRRDVRTRPPRPAPHPNFDAANDSARWQHGTEADPHHGRWDEPEDSVALPSRVQRPARSRQGQMQAELPAGRFARTRATADGLGGDSEVLHQQGRRAPPRRRQPMPGPPPPPVMRPVRPKRRASRKPLIALVVVAMLAGGWLAYLRWGGDVLAPAIQQLTQAIGLAGAGRTAADTPFGASLPPDQALAKLAGQSENADSAADTASESAPVTAVHAGPDESVAPAGPTTTVGIDDPAPVGGEDPPRPVLKPRTPLPTRSVAGGTRAGDEQLAANEARETTVESRGPLSVFEKLWRYLAPG